MKQDNPKEKLLRLLLGWQDLQDISMRRALYVPGLLRETDGQLNSCKSTITSCRVSSIRRSMVSQLFSEQARHRFNMSIYCGEGCTYQGRSQVPTLECSWFKLQVHPPQQSWQVSTSQSFRLMTLSIETMCYEFKTQSKLLIMSVYLEQFVKTQNLQPIFIQGLNEEELGQNCTLIAHKFKPYQQQSLISAYNNELIRFSSTAVIGRSLRLIE